MAIQNVLPLSVGKSSTNADLATKLGELYEKPNAGSPGAKIYRLVKNGSSGTLTKNQLLITGLTLGVPTWVVTTTTTARLTTVAGVVPADFGSDTIADGAYFLLQVDGPALVNMALTTSSITSAITALTTSTAAGMAQEIATTSTPTIYDQGAVFGKAMASGSMSTAGTAAACIIQGLL